MDEHSLLRHVFTTVMFACVRHRLFKSDRFNSKQLLAWWMHSKRILQIVQQFPIVLTMWSQRECLDTTGGIKLRLCWVTLNARSPRKSPGDRPLRYVLRHLVSTDTPWAASKRTIHEGQSRGLEAARSKQAVVAAVKATTDVMRAAGGNRCDGGDTASRVAGDELRLS